MSRPLLRFNSFTENWVPSNIGDLANMVMGFAFKSSNFQKEGIQLIRMSNLYQGYLQLNRSPVFLPENYKNDYLRFLISKNDLVMSMTGTLGKRDYGFIVRISDDGKFFLNQRVMKVIEKKDSNRDFLLYLLKNEKILTQLYSLPGGTKQANLSAEHVKSINVVVPLRKEQQKIGSFLTSIDSKISQLTEKYRLLKEYKKGAIQQIFSQQLRFKDENGKVFPEWGFVALNKLANKQSQKNRNKAVKEVLTNSAKHGILLQSAYFDKKIANDDNTDNYHVVDVDDFVYNPRISELAPVGPVGRNKVIQGVMSPLYSVFRFSNLVDLNFIEYFFIGSTWYRYMHSVANFGARHDRMNISSSDLMNLPCPYPCLKEQQKIALFLQSIDNKVGAVAQQVEQTKQFKKGLLQQMFV